MTILNSYNVKTRMSAVKETIKQVLKVDTGSQSAYHVLAVANGFKNDNEMSAVLSRDFYQLSANLGTEDKPFVVTHDLGIFENYHQALHAGENVIRNCNQEIEWKLLINGEYSQVGIFSQESEPYRGYQLKLIINDNNLDGLRETLENISYRIEGGDFSGSVLLGQNTYQYNILGEEYDPIRDCDNFAPSSTYVIFDDNGIIYADNSEDEILGYWETREERSGDWADGWEGDLVMGVNISLQDALQADDMHYYAISHDNTKVYGGEIMDILDSMHDETAEFHLYMQVKIDR